MLRRLLVLPLLLLAATAGAQERPDLGKQPTLYLVGYAHLDTQWRWELPRTIADFLPKTMSENFALLARYPHYVFNFSGANRYRLMKEYYPVEYERVRQFAQRGRWFPAGAAMEEGDVNSPSAESIVRQILYGSRFFRRELGRSSVEYMLPDSLGFPASLPSILAHMGIKGFSTQKLTWGSNAPAGGEGSPEETPRGIPFNVGVWEGPDGRGVIAAFNPGDTSGDVRYDLSKSDPANTSRGYVDWPKRVQRNGDVSGVYADYHYYGDTGGSPSEASVALVEKMVTANDGPLRVVSATAEQMFLDIKETARLPRYRGDLELTNHSAGSLTSQAMQKRWNRENEARADAAERASVAAMWLGGRAYPQQRLNDAWTLVMGGQFHDIAAGTATPKAYQYSWNDEVIARNQFDEVLTSATESIASALDTRTKGTPLVVYNPLNVDREDVVEASVDVPGNVRVVGPDGKDVPAQRDHGKVIFLAKVPSVGFAVYDVQGGQAKAPLLRDSLENARYKITIDNNGDIAQIVDKKQKKDLLTAPIRLALQSERPHDWPAWNMDWEDQKQPPRGFVSGPAAVRVVEHGPARVAVEVTREAEGSKFVQTIRLAGGDAGNRIEIANAIDWKSSAAALKATFPLTASNPRATYNWEVGTVERGNNEEKQFEVASHDWIDLTDKSGASGVTILTGGKYGSDKPDDATLRLTLLYTPGLGSGNGLSYEDQTSQDWGHHDFVYGLAAHAGDWRREHTAWQALRLEQPLIAFEAPKHEGALGRTFSLLRVDNTAVRVLALKKAEDGNEIVVRIVETEGKPASNVRLAFAAQVLAAREITGLELPLGEAGLGGGGGALVTSLKPYEIRSFAVKLGTPPVTIAPPDSQSVFLLTDRVVASRDFMKPAPGFDDAGHALPAELLPPVIAFGGVRFKTNGMAVLARGQRLTLPGPYSRVYVLAAAVGGDQKATFRVGDVATEVTVHDWSGFLGQWDTRLWRQRVVELPPRPDAPANAPPRSRTVTEFAGLTPGFVKDAPLAWFASHHHNPDATNEPYAYAYLFAYALDVPAGAKTLTLPDNDKIRILAATMSNEGPRLREVLK
jgi:alpha-mannosidase